MTGKSETAIAIIMAAAILTAGGLLVLLGPGEETWGTGTLPAFEDRAQMQRFLQRAQGGDQWNGIAEELAGDSAATGQEVRHSTTNVQVNGVDEADCVKTDGTFLYMASGEVISIVRAYPVEQLSNSSSVNVRTALGLDANYSVWIQGIYLSPARLAAVVTVSGPYSYYGSYPGMAMPEGAESFAPEIWRTPGERTLVLVFSLSPEQPPQLLGWQGASGYAVTSRMIGSVVYLVTQHYIWMYGSDISFPEAWDGNSSAAIPAPSVRYDPECKDPGSFINVLAMDVTSLQGNVTSILASYASTIYVSERSMYLTFQKYDGGDEVAVGVSSSGQDSAARVSSDSATTTIYKLGLDGLSVAPLARGDVPGYLLNQFSLDEAEGRLRVATTFSWGNERSSVYVLDQGLQVIGALEDLAPGERIYSCRFMGDTLYLVTFRQVDPLFVIDLSDPTSPQVRGELKVPGFSSYLHPVGDGRLVGIGMENGSVKLSLFDVTNASAPAELSTVLVPGWSYSEALWDHKAVLYDDLTGSLVIPVTSWDRSGWSCTSGSFVFQVDDDSVELKGVVEPDQGEYVMRAHFIGDHLYTVTDTSVYVNSLSDLAFEAKLVYKERVYYLLPWLMAEGDVVAIGTAK